MSKRHLVLFTLCFATLSFLSLVLGSAFSAVSLIVFVALFLIFLIFWLILRDRRVTFFVILSVFGIVALSLCLFVHLPRLDRAKCLDGEYISATGQVVSMSETEYYYSFIVDSKIDSLDKEKHKIFISTKKEGAPPMDLGRKITFSGVAEFQNSMYDKGNECFLRVYPSSVEFHPESESDIFGRIVYFIRTTLNSSISKSNTAPLGRAMLLGDKTELSDEVLGDFRRIGTSHLLSLSGLHLSVIAMSFLSLCHKFGLNHKLSSLLTILLVFLYMLITGFSLSLVRAGQMLVLLLISRALRRQRDSITTLFFAGLMVMLLSPWSFFNIGFQLSFLSTLGIICFYVPDRREYYKRLIIKNENKPYTPPKHPKLQWALRQVARLVYMTMSATVFTAPLVLLYFNEISLFSLIGNLLTVAIAQYYLQFLFFSASLSSLGSRLLSAPFTFISNLLGEVLLWLTSTLSKISPPMTSLNFDYLLLGVFLVTVLIGAFIPFMYKRFLLPVIVCVLALFIPLFNAVTYSIDRDCHLVNTSAGSGVNTTLLRLADKAYILDQTDSDSGMFGNLNYYLKLYNIQTVDEAFFIAMSLYPLKRIESMLSFTDVERITVLSYCEDYEGYYKLLSFAESHDLDIKVEFCTERAILDSVDAYIYPELCTAFVIRGDDETLTLYRSRNKAYINENLFSRGVVFFDGDNPLFDREVLRAERFPTLSLRVK